VVSLQENVGKRVRDTLEEPNKRRLEGGKGGVYDDKRNREPYVGTRRRARGRKLQ
jgi:hypothetical protein